MTDHSRWHCLCRRLPLWFLPREGLESAKSGEDRAMADSPSFSKTETPTRATQDSLGVVKDTTEFGTRVWPGSPNPLGVTWDGKGVNVAIFSENAERVELCLFDDKGERETGRIALPEYTNQKWHGYFPDLRPGHLYDIRVYGPYDPKNGHRFNHNKLLLDPYAKRLVGRFIWNDALYGYSIGHADADLSFDARDRAPFMPKF